MKLFRSNKTKPQPVPQILKATPPTSPIKARLDPALLDLMGNVKEKKVD